MTNTFKTWNIAAGNFFFKVRNFLFPLIYLVIFGLAKPKLLFNSQELTNLWIYAGMGIAIVGQLIRVATIGFDYIERGGKEGKVFASFLVKGGVYAHCRNPMYVGNVLIACGLSIATATPLVMGVAIPLFLFIYQAITAAEENYLMSRFGGQYQDYCATVNRFIPSLSGLRASLSVPYDWQKSLRKEYGTIFFVITSLLIIHGWRDVSIYGWPAFNQEHRLTFLILSVVSIGGYLTVRFLKKRGLLKGLS